MRILRMHPGAGLAALLVLAAAQAAMAGTVVTAINFDELSAPAGTANANPLRDEYYDAVTGKGVRFTGPTELGGAAVLDLTGFPSLTETAPNALLWNDLALQNGGISTGPEKIEFLPSAQYVSFYVASQTGFGTGQTLTINGTTLQGNSITPVDVVLTAAMQLVEFDGRDLASLTLSAPANTIVSIDSLFIQQEFPDNDTCETAVGIGPGVSRGNTSNADTQYLDECAYNDGKDVWFSFIAAATGDVDINTTGSGFDTSLAVYEGCPTGGHGPVLACRDDGGGGNAGSSTRTEVIVEVVQGHTYLIRLAGFNGTGGKYALTLGAVNAFPLPSCGESANFPSADSDLTHSEANETTTAIWSVVAGHKVVEYVQTRLDAINRVVLDIPITNGLNDANSCGVAVKVNDVVVGTFTVSAADPSFIVQHIDAAVDFTQPAYQYLKVSIEATTTVPGGGGALIFNLGGTNTGTIQFFGPPSETFQATDRGWYNSAGDHDSTNKNTITGVSESDGPNGGYHSYFIFKFPGDTSKIQSASLRLEVENYSSSDASEMVGVYLVDGTTAANLSANQTGQTAIYNDLVDGPLLTSFTLTAADVGTVRDLGVFSAAALPALINTMSSNSGNLRIGLKLLTQTHLPGDGVNEYVRFSFDTEVLTHTVTFDVCPSLPDNSLLALGSDGDFFEVDIPHKRVEILTGPLLYNAECEGTTKDHVLGSGLFGNALYSVDVDARIASYSIDTTRYFTGLELQGGTMYGVSTADQSGAGSTRLYSIVQDTGVATQIGASLVAAERTDGLAFKSSTSKYYTVGQGATGILYEVNIATGAGTPIGETGHRLASLECGADGILYAGGAGADAGKVFSIDPATAAATLVLSARSFDITGLTVMNTAPTSRREFGDFDNNGCTDIADFLTLLDFWTLVDPAMGGEAIGIADFLALLDNWNLGPTCP